MAAMLAAIAVLGVFDPGFAAVAPAGPFAEVPVPPAVRHSRRLAYACLASGVALGGASFALAHRANRSYDRYLIASEPAEIERLFDETGRLDRWSSGSLLAGEALFAAGLYLRFLRHSSPDRLAVVVGIQRCAVSLRF